MTRSCQVDRTFGDGRSSRRYGLFLPTPRGGRAPLVVVLHGSGQTAADFAACTGMNEVAEEYGAIVVYPEQPFSANFSRSWHWYLEGDQGRDAGEPAIIAGITRRIMVDFEVDAARVYVAGFFAGGAAAAVMALAYPDVYAAVCVHSGLASGAATGLVSAFEAMRAGGRSREVSAGRVVPAIVFHGDRDEVVNHANAEQIVIQMSGDRLWRLFTGEGRSTGGMSYTRNGAIVERWSLNGAGHSWSGGSAGASHKAAALGPDASREMMRFFLQYPTTNGPSDVLGPGLGLAADPEAERFEGMTSWEPACPKRP